MASEFVHTLSAVGEGGFAAQLTALRSQRGGRETLFVSYRQLHEAIVKPQQGRSMRQYGRLAEGFSRRQASDTERAALARAGAIGAHAASADVMELGEAARLLTRVGVSQAIVASLLRQAPSRLRVTLIGDTGAGWGVESWG
jgi:hypothetical protein